MRVDTGVDAAGFYGAGHGRVFVRQSGIQPEDGKNSNYCHPANNFHLNEAGKYYKEHGKSLKGYVPPAVPQKRRAATESSAGAEVNWTVFPGRYIRFLLPMSRFSDRHGGHAGWVAVVDVVLVPLTRHIAPISNVPHVLGSGAFLSALYVYTRWRKMRVINAVLVPFLYPCHETILLPCLLHS